MEVTPTSTTEPGPKPVRLPGALPALTVLLAINLFNYLDRFILVAVVPNIQAEFFAKDDPNAMGSVGWLAPAFLVSYMVAAPIFGLLAARMSRWWLIGMAVGLWSLASGASGLAGTFLILLATRVFVGIGEGGYGPTAPTLISDYFPISERGRMMSYFYMAIPVGSALGYAFGGEISARLGWRWPFYLVTAPGLLLALVCLFRRDPRDRSKPVARPGTSLEQYKRLTRIPSFVFNTVAMSAMTFALGGVGFWVPSYLHVYRGLPDLARVTTTFGVITVVAGFAATLCGGWLGDRFRERNGGSYFLVSGIGMLIAPPLFSGGAVRALSAGLGLSRAGRLLSLFQHRTEQRRPRQRHPGGNSGHRLCPEYSLHTHPRRRVFADHHWLSGRLDKLHSRLSAGGGRNARGRHRLALWREAFEARYGRRDGGKRSRVGLATARADGKVATMAGPIQFLRKCWRGLKRLHLGLYFLFILMIGLGGIVASLFEQYSIADLKSGLSEAQRQIEAEKSGKPTSPEATARLREALKPLPHVSDSAPTIHRKKAPADVNVKAGDDRNSWAIIFILLWLWPLYRYYFSSKPQNLLRVERRIIDWPVFLFGLTWLVAAVHYLDRMASYRARYGEPDLRTLAVFAAGAFIFGAFAGYLNLELTQLYVRRFIARPFFRD